MDANGAASEMTTGSRSAWAPATLRCPALLWALLGALFIAVGTISLIRWLTSGTARFTVGDYRDLDGFWRAEVIVMQAVAAMIILAVIAALVRESRKAGGLSFRAMICGSLVALFWFDPFGYPGYHGIVNYNRAWMALSTWGPYLPGWHSPDANIQIEPILLVFPGYVLIMAWIFGTGWVVQLVESWRSARLSGLSLVMIGLVASVMVDVVVQLICIPAGWWALPRAIPALTLFYGYQWQLSLPYCFVEGICLGGIPYLVGRFHDAAGPDATFILRGFSRLPGRIRPAVWSLAIVGFVGVYIIVFIVGYQLLARIGTEVPLQGPYHFI